MIVQLSLRLPPSGPSHKLDSQRTIDVHAFDAHHAAFLVIASVALLNSNDVAHRVLSDECQGTMERCIPRCWTEHT